MNIISVYVRNYGRSIFKTSHLHHAQQKLGKGCSYHSTVDTFLRQKLSMAKPYLGTSLRLKQPHPPAASFYANTTQASVVVHSQFPGTHLPAGTWLTVSARLGTEGSSQWEQGPPAMPTLHLARPAIKGRDTVAACRMLAWHARTRHGFWLMSNNLISEHSDSVDQGHIKPPKSLWN